MSTTLASIGDADYFVTMPCPAYKISKAALNALTVQYALEYAKEGFTFLALSPGVRLFCVFDCPGSVLTTDWMLIPNLNSG